MCQKTPYFLTFCMQQKLMRIYSSLPTSYSNLRTKNVKTYTRGKFILWEMFFL